MLITVVELEDARRLSPAERVVLRLRVVAALVSGKVAGYRQAAELFGVPERLMIQEARGEPAA